MSYYLAIDIGASSGRHILGQLKDEKLELFEIHRFKNDFFKKNGSMCWDTESLFSEIVAGLKKCGEAGKIPVSVGIDTWGVDFVLLDKNEEMVGDAVSYRDGRTEGMDDILDTFISESDLYARTGIQKAAYNTIYQLLALKVKQPDLLKKADRLLFTPEYYSYLLTGKMAHEYTIASTSGLINAHTKSWDIDLIKMSGLPKRLFGEISPPGTALGNLLPEIVKQIGFDTTVILPCTHDTGSAVAAAPIGTNDLYLSSGTWSLMGAELENPICNNESHLGNLSNEGGYDARFRYLKNIMGLWIIQCIKKECGDQYGFSDLSAMARKSQDFPSRINVDESRFFAPDHMTEEIKAALRDSGQSVPNNIGELVACAYQSLAESYAAAVDKIEKLTHKNFERICIVGGGSQNEYLNQLTAKACGKKVTAGPVEATAIGNILVQMIAAKDLPGLLEARELVKKSFAITEV